MQFNGRILRALLTFIFFNGPLDQVLSTPIHSITQNRSINVVFSVHLVYKEELNLLLKYLALSFLISSIGGLLFSNSGNPKPGHL